ncbi:MAG: UTP--glucose-1-phosphate uridylyltransferase GalU [Candidatus Methanofastidiosia archaeon]
MKAVIPAAGLGTRFLPATKAQPKEMLCVVDKPTIQYVVEEALNSGIEDILIITGKGKGAIEDHFNRSFELEERLKEKGKLDYLKMIEDSTIDLHYIRQKEPKGLGDAILCAQRHVGDEEFAVLLGDDIIKSEIPCTKQLLKIFSRFGCSILAVEKVSRERLQKYGIVDFEPLENNLYKVKNLVEKPSANEAPSNLGTVGRYILTPEIFDCIRETPIGLEGEIWLTDALNILLRRKEIYAYEFQGRRYDVGDKLEYLKAMVEFGLERKGFGEEFRDYLKGLKL